MLILGTCEISCQFPWSISSFNHHLAGQIENLAHNWSVLCLINWLPFMFYHWLTWSSWGWILFHFFSRMLFCCFMTSSINSGMVASTYVSPPWSNWSNRESCPWLICSLSHQLFVFHVLSVTLLEFLGLNTVSLIFLDDLCCLYDFFN